MKKMIKFSLNPNIQDNENVGEKGNEFLKSHGFSDDVVKGQVMIIQELIKYGVYSGCFTPLRPLIHVCMSSLIVQGKDQLQKEYPAMSVALSVLHFALQ